MSRGGSDLGVATWGQTGAVLAIVCAVFGLAIGSFLNVVVWRVPRGESVVRPPSACPGCHKAIRTRDNVPVLGWLLLRGRCRDCGEPISVRYPLVEAGTGALFAMMAVRFGLDAALPAFLYLAAVGLALALIDLDTKRLPDVLTLPAYPVGGVLLVVAALVDHEPQRLLQVLSGGAALFALYYVLWFFGGMGYGDVKLAGVLGGYLGYLGLAQWIVGTFGGFFIGGIISLILLATGKAGRKTRVPHGPFMLAGTLVGIVAGGLLADAYLSVSGV